MSGGGLSGSFWRDQMIPILMERYHDRVYQYTGTFTKEIEGLKYRYVAEKRECCYFLRLQKWKEECNGWGDRFPSGWADWDSDTHIYADLESSQRDGNIFLVEHAECKLLQMENRTIRFVTFIGIAYVMDVCSFEILETHMTK